MEETISIFYRCRLRLRLGAWAGDEMGYIVLRSWRKGGERALHMGLGLLFGWLSVCLSVSLAVCLASWLDRAARGCRLLWRALVRDYGTELFSRQAVWQSGCAYMVNIVIVNLLTFEVGEFVVVGNSAA